MNKKAARPIVVKIGGSTLGANDTSLADCAQQHADGRPIILVHGGGAAVSEWLTRIDVAVEFVEGLRKTTAEARAVVVAVLAGLINTQLVQELTARGAPAVGLTGVDGGMIRSAVNERGLGYVGEAPICDPTLLRSLLAAALLPVVAPIGVTPDGQELLNINADAAAGAIAEAVEAEALVFLTDVPGILDVEGRVVAMLDGGRIAALREQGVISGGMLPKVEACLRAAQAGARARIVDGRTTGALRSALSGNAGTLVRWS